MDEQQFKRLKSVSAKSFNDQKALIKKVLAGREIACSQCGTFIRVNLPEDKKTTGCIVQKVVPTLH